MNSIFGIFGGSDKNTPRGMNWGFSEYRQYLKQDQVPRPAKTWLILDEHPDSINDGYFINNPTASNWQDVPASYHNGACGFAFADGHSEIHKWRACMTQPRAKTVVAVDGQYLNGGITGRAGDADIHWMSYRGGRLTQFSY